jgi:hypothetical protein
VIGSLPSRYQKISTPLTALTIYNSKISHEMKILTRFIITHYRDNTCGTEGATALTSFKNNVNTKTQVALARKTQQFLPISKAPDDGRVGRNM